MECHCHPRNNMVSKRIYVTHCSAKKDDSLAKQRRKYPRKLVEEVRERGLNVKLFTIYLKWATKMSENMKGYMEYWSIYPLIKY
ncbi:hypothetical protein SAMN02745195_01144 [Thermoanaerobacter uzonensis DSM 18761]|uniref:Uncharacterized protein n=1 Tax=Thermoanaerobacter uzonensis DSM 18761 TaxID=1123369 RepID=A0A1M4W7D1_9THEO|nr:hypothetical protein SAMN02745195_01144 [Thermoanaerobacter uzonensis DSM 18761]